MTRERLTDPDLVAVYTYDPYGTLLSGTPDSPFGYSGQYTDSTSSLINDRARWYNTQTGGFTTEDPELATTDQPYQYAGGDPINNADPSGNVTLGICAGANFDLGIGFGIAANAEDCLTRSLSGGNVYFTGSLGGGGAVGLDGSVGSYVQVSNASSPKELSGPFSYFGGAAQFIDGASAIVFWNSNFSVFGTDVDPGLDFGAGAAISGGSTGTKVVDLGNWWSPVGLAARATWDSLRISSSLVQSDLSSAAREIRDHLESSQSQPSAPQRASLLPCTRSAAQGSSFL